MAPIKLFVVALLCTLGIAWAQACQHVTTVSVTAAGAAFPVQSQSLADAVTAALNQAITQARGVYVTARTELIDEYRSSIVKGAATTQIDKSVSQEIQSRFSGFVTHYQVIHQQQLGGGAVQVTIRANICLDTRIAVAFDSSTAMRNAILSRLVPAIREVGWNVLLGAPDPEASPQQLIKFTYENGVTYIAVGHVRSSIGTSEGLVHADVLLNEQLIDTTTMQITHTFSYEVKGLGASRAAAIQDAGQHLGIKLARSWNELFLAKGSREHTTFVFRGVRRAGTRFTLQDIVKQLSGVLLVYDLQYDGGAHEVTMELELAADPCLVAQAVTQYHRVTTTLSSCSAHRAVFLVTGD